MKEELYVSEEERCIFIRADELVTKVINHYNEKIYSDILTEFQSLIE